LWKCIHLLGPKPPESEILQDAPGIIVTLHEGGSVMFFITTRFRLILKLLRGIHDIGHSKTIEKTGILNQLEAFNTPIHVLATDKGTKFPDNKGEPYKNIVYFKADPLNK
jgi:hypothetical protein